MATDDTHFVCKNYMKYIIEDSYHFYNICTLKSGTCPQAFFDHNYLFKEIISLSQQIFSQETA